MSNVPDGAQLSEDGQTWWDGQQWQPVTQDDSAASGGATDDRSAARVAKGLPAALNDLTDDQRQGYLGQPTIEVEAGAAEQVEVLAMQDTTNDSGEAVA